MQCNFKLVEGRSKKTQETSEVRSPFPIPVMIPHQQHLLNSCFWGFPVWQCSG